MRFSKFFFFLLLLVAKISVAQTNINTEIFGRVTDAKTKEPLGYVNVRLYGGVPKATMTNPKGEFSVRSIEKVDSIVFSYLGYGSRNIRVKRGGTQELNIEMGSEELKLVEITVKAGKKRKREIDTTANYVFYQVLKHKEQNRVGASYSYHYENYDKLEISLLNPGRKLINFFLFKPFRFAFENTDTTSEGSMFIPGIIKETVSDVYYRLRPKKQMRTYVKAEHMTGIDNPAAVSLANYEFRETDAYDNLYYFAKTYFNAPFAPGALNTYYYYVTDTQKIEDRISYKIHFVGKTKEDLALKGYAWIDSATWAIRTIFFKPNEKANLNFINEYNAHLDYTLVDGKFWMKNREQMQSVGSIFKKKNRIGLLVEKLVEKKNFEANVLFPDSIFKGVEETIIADSARNMSKEFWDTARFEKLTQPQERVFEISDTMKKVKAWKTYEWFGRFFTAAYADAGPISFGRVLNFGSRNNVEGWRVRFGFETNVRYQHRGTTANNFLRKFYFTGYVAYGLKDRDFKYLALTRFALPRKNERWQSLEAMYRYDMRVPGQDENQTLLTFDNIVTLISGRTLNKIMKVREAQISYEKEWVRDFSTIFTINDKIYYEIPTVSDFIKKENAAVHHVPNFNVTEFMLDTRYSYKDLYFVGAFYRYFQTTKYPVIMLRYSFAMVNMERDYFNYQTLHFILKQRIVSPIGHTNFSFKAGKIFGKAPYTSCYLTQGNLGILLDKFNYNLLREFEFISDQYAQLWVEHHFNGFIFNKIPGFNKLKLREVIIFKSLIGSFSKRNADVLLVPQELRAPGPVPYIELGFGIENIAYLFRVDFLWRATYRNSGGQNWGIKLAFQPGF